MDVFPYDPVIPIIIGSSVLRVSFANFKYFLCINVSSGRVIRFPIAKVNGALWMIKMSVVSLRSLVIMIGI